MKSHTKVKPFFLTSIDEKLFSEEIKKVYPAVRFVDDSRWNTPEPIVRESIDECKSNYVFLWPSNLIDKLPTVPFRDEFDGPQSGIVMQFMRCKLKDGCLLSGQLGVGYSEKNLWMADWSKSIFKILNRMNITKLKTVGNDSYITSDYIVGENALSFHANGGHLRHNSASVDYEIIVEN